MRKLGITLTLLLLELTVLFAVSSEDTALLKQAEESTSFKDTDFAAEYTIVQSKPGQGQNATYAVLYRRDKEETYTIVITGPDDDDKGKGYIQYNSSIWFFDPSDRKFTFTTKKDKVEGTNATPADFTPQYYTRDYKIEKTEDVNLGNFKCTLFYLTAKTKNVTYSKVQLWVSKDDGLIRMKKDFSLSSQLLRTTAMPSYQKINKRSVPVTILIIDNLRGKKINNKMQYEKTQITINNVSFDKLKDVIFTKAYLQMINE
ncbi:MAG: outer membrane lipoprotein-sorting protein [Treponema sp. CETP13]|nr:MAG: outer membrane lipoprotein-sorting protein [Treponema sp. CETP13]